MREKSYFHAVVVVYRSKWSIEQVHCDHNSAMSTGLIESRPENRHSQAPYPVQKSADRNLTVTIQSLPHELLVMVLKHSLPQVALDDKILLPSDPCPEYVDALYSLRSICGAWRYLVDGNTSFWKVVCSQLPMEVNSALIAKSGQSTLIVHRSDTRPDLVAEFMELANSQRTRWATALFQFSASDVDSVTCYLAEPAPQLQSLSLEGDPSLNADIETSISLLGGQTQNIRKLNIFATPIQWSSNPFTRLKSLQLRRVEFRDGGPTIQHILDILACSPALETFKLRRTELLPTPIDTHSPKLRLPLLQSLSLFAISATTVERILDRIAVDPDIVTQIDIYSIQDEHIFNESHFLTKTLPPFGPVFRRLNKHYEGSALEIHPGGDFTWRSKKSQGHYFQVRFQGIGIQASLPWLEQAVGIDDVGVSIHLDSPVSTVEHIEMLSTLDRSRIVTGVDVTFAFGSSGRNAVLDAVLWIKEANDGQAGMVAIPSFPSLRTIHIDNWAGSLDGIELALRKRFAKRAMMEVRLPNLLVKITYFTVRVANNSDGILHYDNTHRIREINGVRDFRIGDYVTHAEREAGILAVVWCEASSRVVWG